MTQHAELVLELEDLLDNRLPSVPGDADVTGTRVSVAQLVLAGVIAQVAEDSGMATAMELADLVGETMRDIVNQRLREVSLN